MQTTIFQIEFNNGSTYYIFCANINQISRFKGKLGLLKNKGLVKDVKVVLNGIHNIGQWDNIAEHILKN